MTKVEILAQKIINNWINAGDLDPRNKDEFEEKTKEAFKIAQVTYEEN